MKILKLTFFLFVLSGLFSCNETNESKTVSNKKISLANKLDTISYLVGYTTGNGLGSQGIDKLNDDVFLAALNEGLNSNEAQIDLNEAGMAIREYMFEKRQGLLKENLEKGEQFLEKNAKKDGIKTTESGLQYKIIEQGDGEKPNIGDKIKVHYTGTTIDGKEFDSSKDNPAEFVLGRVIKGWNEGLQLMPVGSKYKFYIPANLAYGERSQPNIPANSVLIFDVELIDIVEKAK